MTTGETITVIGWPVSCALSILAGWGISRITRKRKTLAWAVVSESELIPEALHETLSLPVSIKVGDEDLRSLSLITFRVGNAGNEVISTIDAAVTLNKGSKVLYIKPTQEMGEFQKCFEGKIEDSKVRLRFDFLNPKADCEFEMLVSNYELRSMMIDVAAPGVETIRKSATDWSLSSSIIRGVSLSLLGVRYDPSVSALNEIASELKTVRKSIKLKE